MSGIVDLSQVAESYRTDLRRCVEAYHLLINAPQFDAPAVCAAASRDNSLSAIQDRMNRCSAILDADCRFPWPVFRDLFLDLDHLDLLLRRLPPAKHRLLQQWIESNMVFDQQGNQGLLETFQRTHSATCSCAAAYLAHSNVAFTWGLSFLRQNRWAMALTILKGAERQLATLSSRCKFEALTALGIAYLGARQFDLAAAAFERALLFCTTDIKVTNIVHGAAKTAREATSRCASLTIVPTANAEHNPPQDTYVPLEAKVLHEVFFRMIHQTKHSRDGRFLDYKTGVRLQLSARRSPKQRIHRRQSPGGMPIEASPARPRRTVASGW